jgi:Dyp-type peroxidase family
VIVKTVAHRAVNWENVQGLVLYAYSKLAFAAYIPWRFTAESGCLVGKSSQAWLQDLIPRLTVARKEPAEVALNVALTWTGLKKLGATLEELSSFSTEFREGMAPQRTTSDTSFPRRCNVLGDIGANSPEFWEWGGWSRNSAEGIDGLLLLYALDETLLAALIKSEMGQMRGHIEFLQCPSGKGNSTALILRGQFRKSQDMFREHFGFVDGISQPIIDGTPKASRQGPAQTRISVVQPGEFVLGYVNERGYRVGYPIKSSEGTTAKAQDLTHNGTYLVFRQLEQNVPAFRAELSRTANATGQSESWVAARMVGRTIDGEPLIPASLYAKKKRLVAKFVEWVAERMGRPTHIDDPEKKRNNFLYYFEDRFGLSCPLGAHIRRANPRDTVIGPDPDTSLRLSKMHRIIRRGRPYGMPLDETPPERQDERRGMLFICLNADIAGQFEIIQHSWINNGRFGGLYGETDPILNYPGEARILTIQRPPTSEGMLRGDDDVRRHGRTPSPDNLEQFVTVRGGAYFFLPGIEALQFLADQLQK